jgi:hypothetical protein
MNDHESLPPRLRPAVLETSGAPASSASWSSSAEELLAAAARVGFFEPEPGFHDSSGLAASGRQQMRVGVGRDPALLLLRAAIRLCPGNGVRWARGQRRPVAEIWSTATTLPMAALQASSDRWR